MLIDPCRFLLIIRIVSIQTHAALVGMSVHFLFYFWLTERSLAGGFLVLRFRLVSDMRFFLSFLNFSYWLGSSEADTALVGMSVVRFLRLGHVCSWISKLQRRLVFMSEYFFVLRLLFLYRLRTTETH